MSSNRKQNREQNRDAYVVLATKRRPGKVRVRPATECGGSGRAKASPLRGPPYRSETDARVAGGGPSSGKSRGALETPPVDGEPRPPPRTATPTLARHAAPDVRPRCAGCAHRLWLRRPARLQHHPHERPGFPQQPHPRVRGGCYISPCWRIYTCHARNLYWRLELVLSILWPPPQAPNASAAARAGAKKKRPKKKYVGKGQDPRAHRQRQRDSALEGGQGKEALALDCDPQRTAIPICHNRWSWRCAAAARRQPPAAAAAPVRRPVPSARGVGVGCVPRLSSRPPHLPRQSR